MAELEHVGFKSMLIYDESHAHFDAPWQLLVAFKGRKSGARWYKTSPEVEVEIHRRIHRTKSGNRSLRYFDGATMMGYQIPAKAQEITYCRKSVKPQECKLVGTPISQKRAVRENANDAFHILPSTWSVIDDLRKQPYHDDEADGLSSVVTLCRKGCIGASNIGEIDLNLVYSPVVARRHLQHILVSEEVSIQILSICDF